MRLKIKDSICRKYLAKVKRTRFCYLHEAKAMETVELGMLIGSKPGQDSCPQRPHVHVVEGPVGPPWLPTTWSPSQLPAALLYGSAIHLSVQTPLESIYVASLCRLREISHPINSLPVAQRSIPTDFSWTCLPRGSAVLLRFRIWCTSLCSSRPHHLEADHFLLRACILSTALLTSSGCLKDPGCCSGTFWSTRVTHF